MKKFLLALLLLCPQQSFAAEEDWYTYWSFGFSNNSYGEPLDSFFNSLESSPGVDRVQGAIDMLGFYWPIQDKLNLGFVISGSFDAFTIPMIGNIQINQYLYGASVMKFFGRETGDGLFLRGDVGLAAYSITADTTIGSATSTSDTGTGILLGIGYGVPVSEESRILFSINISSKNIEGNDMSAVSFNIGGLW